MSDLRVGSPSAHTIQTAPAQRAAAAVRPVSQAALFRRLRWRLLVNSFRTLWDSSPIRPISILLCSLVVWLFIFFVSFEGFRFLQRDVRLPLGGEIVGTLFDVLFMLLGVLLIFSSGLVLYASLFGSPETAFLLSRPVRDDRVFAFKFQGALAFSSWAFLLLGAPLLVAYGLVRGSPWEFYALLPLFFLGFILVPGSLGGMACLVIVNFLPKRRKQVLVIGALAIVGLLGAWGLELLRASRPENWGAESVNVLLDRFEFARSRFAPTHWMARGLRAAGGRNPGDLEKTFYNLALIWSNGLFLYMITAAVAGKLYRRGYNRLSTGGDLRRKYGGLWMDRLLSRGLGFVRPGTRLLIVKDFRTFRREPQQWAQVLIFSILLTLYFTNIRRLFPGQIDWVHQNGLSMLNVCTVSLLLCTYTGRFVYPMLSLEGRKFWILGLLPLRREQLLWGKFTFSTTMVLGIAGVLVLLSDLMLNMPAVVLLMHLLAVTVVAAGLSGLSVGLGAWMPNFRETDPSKIAVGFGGTLNLVAGLFFLVTILVLMVLPWHLVTGMAAGYALVRGRDPALDLMLTPAAVAWIVAGMVAGLGVGIGAVVIPLRMGTRALQRMEF
jgi:ABC-2 type transport system permease protein